MHDLEAKIFSVDSPLALEGLPQIFSVGMALQSDKLAYDYLFSKLAPLAIDACVQKIPGQKDFSTGDTIDKALGELDKLTDKYRLTLEMNEDFKSEKMKYFAVTGHTQNKELALTIIANKPKSKRLGVMAAVVIDTALFGKLMTDVMGSNPFKSVPSLSNLKLVASVSTSDFALPTGVTLPSPFSDNKEIKAGFCFDGLVQKPSSCRNSDGGNDSVCTLLKKVMAKTGGVLGLSGCMAPNGISLTVKVLNVRFNADVLMPQASLFFKTALSPKPSAVIGGSVTLSVKMPQLVTFFGTAYVKQKGVQSLLGLGLGELLSMPVLCP